MNSFQRPRRALIVILALAAVLLALAAFALRVPGVADVVRALPIGPDSGPTPRPPVIDEQPGPLPAGVTGLRELEQSDGQGYRSVGSGFFLKLPNGPDIIGVTTAHSVAALGQPGSSLQNLAFALPGPLVPDGGEVGEFSQLYGLPGVPFSGDNLSVDYVLLKPARWREAGLAVNPDPRGAPQPGERVALYSGLGGEAGPVRVLFGTVLTSAPTAVWVLMDNDFDPNGLSGSPVLSAYTGRGVGMAVAATRQRGRLLIGLNPIGSLVAHALAADTFPAIAGFSR